jgi:hypothetical protein
VGGEVGTQTLRITSLVERRYGARRVPDQLRTLREEATQIIARADTLGEVVRAAGERLR